MIDVAKRTRWEPPYPDPNKGQPKRPGDDKPRGWRMPAAKKNRCRIAACDNDVASNNYYARLPLCATHIAAVHDNYGVRQSIVEKCLTCETEAAKKKDQAARRKRDYIGTVYYLLTGDTIKIGWTSDLGQRMRQYPPNSTLLATEDGPRSLEKSRHGLFNEYLVQGREWFSQGEHLNAWIEQLQARDGLPRQIQQQHAAVEADRGQQITKTRHSQWKGREHDGSAAIKRPAFSHFI